MPTVYGDFTAVLRSPARSSRASITSRSSRAKSRVRRTSSSRVHSERLTGDVFHSLRCDCGEQLEQALGRIASEEHGVLLYRAQLGGRRLRLTDDDRRRLAVRAFRLGRRALRQVATIVTPDTLLRWHRQLVPGNGPTRGRSPRRGVLAEIRRLVVRMAEENPTWGYTRIQGALKNVGHRVGRSTIARILKAHGLPPVPERPTSWQTFLRAHKDAIAGADFFTTEVWTWRGLVTCTRCS